MGGPRGPEVAYELLRDGGESRPASLSPSTSGGDGGSGCQDTAQPAAARASRAPAAHRRGPPLARPRRPGGHATPPVFLRPATVEPRIRPRPPSVPVPWP